MDSTHACVLAYVYAHTVHTTEYVTGIVAYYTGVYCCVQVYYTLVCARARERKEESESDTE